VILGQWKVYEKQTKVSYLNFKEFMKKICDFSVVRSLDGIIKNSSIAIYGAGGRGHFLHEELRIQRPDINITCFIDDSVCNSSNGTLVYTYSEAKERCNWDLILVASIHSREIIEKVDVSEKVIIPSITSIVGVDSKERIGVFMCIKNAYRIWRNYIHLSDSASKELYFQLLKQRIFGYGYADRIYASKMFYTKQYFEYINTEVIANVLDAGVHDGYTAFQFMQNFKKIKKVHGFDLSDVALRSGAYKALHDSEKFKLSLEPLADSIFKVYMLLDAINPSASKIQKEKIENGIEILSTTIDKYCQINKIKLDFLKFDIEGAESLALKGGVNTMISDRPQIAVSIYHSPEDFINIPFYLIQILPNYKFFIGHYSLDIYETVLYAIPRELSLSN
jgi:FkbM family methyltransferase